MMRAPCEVSIWYVLPLIRKTLAMQLVETHGLSQAEVARKLSLTDAAVSQYLSGKRAGKDPDVSFMKAQFARGASLIAKAKDGKAVQREVCRLCKFASDNGLLEKIDARKKCERCG